MSDTNIAIGVRPRIRIVCVRVGDMECDPRSGDRGVPSASRKPERGFSQPTRPRARVNTCPRRADGYAPTRDAGTRDNVPSQLGRTTVRGRSNRQSRAPTTTPGREAERPRRAIRSGRVSGIRPSDRRGPGPAGHRGRNVRSTGRCSYNLRITRRRADSCGLHRSTSQVIRRSGSGV